MISIANNCLFRLGNEWKEQQREREREREREAAYLLSHPGQSALASGSQAASQGGRSRSSWPQPGGRQRRTRPGSALRLCRSLTAPFKHTLDSGDSFFQNGSAAFQSDLNFHTSFKTLSLLLLVQMLLPVGRGRQYVADSHSVLLRVSDTICDNQN